MEYNYKLILRLLILLLIPFSIFQFIATNTTLYLSFIILKLFQPTFLIPPFIFFNETIVKFIPACAASLAYYFLFSLILITKDIRFSTRIKMFLLGSLIILTINSARIISLILILHYLSYNLFNLIHIFFWSFIGSILVVLIWIFLIKLYNINSIPFYSDFKYLLKKAASKKKKI